MNGYRKLRASEIIEENDVFMTSKGGIYPASPLSIGEAFNPRTKHLQYYRPIPPKPKKRIDLTGRLHRILGCSFEAQECNNVDAIKKFIQNNYRRRVKGR